MHITTYVAGSCAGSFIQGLGSNANALAAMQRFCSLELTSGESAFGRPAKYQPLAAFYIFIAGPEVAAGQPGSSHHSKAWVRYGTEFAEFIKTHDLGEVVTLGPKLNLKHHASTTCQIWMWNPIQEVLAKWWTENRVKTPPKSVPTPKAPKTRWDVASGVADGVYKCKHCQKTYELGEKIWFSDGIYYCEAYGKEQS